MPPGPALLVAQKGLAPKNKLKSHSKAFEYTHAFYLYVQGRSNNIPQLGKLGKIQVKLAKYIIVKIRKF